MNEGMGHNNQLAMAINWP